MKHFASVLLAMCSLQSKGPRIGTTLERFVRQLDRPNPSVRAAKAETIWIGAFSLFSSGVASCDRGCSSGADALGASRQPN